METSVSLYELNRQIIKQQGPLKENDIKSKIDMLKEFSNTFEKYSLLYGREINYFTLFVKTLIFIIYILNIVIPFFISWY